MEGRSFYVFMKNITIAKVYYITGYTFNGFTYLVHVPMVTVIVLFTDKLASYDSYMK